MKIDYNLACLLEIQTEILCQKCGQRWSYFLRQPAKVDLPMQRTIHHADAETVFRHVQGQGRA